MIAGMGWLLDLCPQPEELVLANLCKQFGVLPSQVKSLDDWQVMADYVNLKNLEGNWNAWDNMMAILAKDPTADVSMDQNLIQYMLDLMEKAREKYGR